MITKQDEEIKEYQDVRYVRELTEYWNAYVQALINEIFVGVGINLGLSPDKAYALAKTDPSKLNKAGFFQNIFDKFKRVFGYKTPKFRVNKPLITKGQPITAEQWDKFNQSLSTYWKAQMDKVTEDMVLKGFLIGRDTAKFRQKRIVYRNKTLPEIQDQQYDGKMPSSIADAYRKFNFKKAEKKAITRSLNNVAMHVSEVENDIKDKIRKQIITGVNKEKSPEAIASDLYWNVQKDGNNAESVRRNWSRIAVTETQTIYESGILAQYEDEAMESMADIRRAQYFAFTGGSCKWCRAHQGTIVRLIPSELVLDKTNDSLSSMGIKDPKTDIAIWIGKNNVGRYSYKEPGWNVCTPAHPHNVATMSPIDFETEFWNDKTGRVEKKQLYRTENVPERKDHVIDKEERKPRFVSTDRVMFNNNLYERVSPERYERAKAEWDKNPSSAIPVSTDSTRYDKIFGEAERNEKL